MMHGMQPMQGRPSIRACNRATVSMQVASVSCNQVKPPKAHIKTLRYRMSEARRRGPAWTAAVRWSMDAW